MGSVVQGTNSTSGSCHGGHNPLLLLLLLHVKGVEGSLHFLPTTGTPAMALPERSLVVGSVDGGCWSIRRIVY